MNVQGRTIAVIDDDLRVLESLVNLLAQHLDTKAESPQIRRTILRDPATSPERAASVTDVEMATK